MRRLAVCAFVVLAAGLVLAPGALASTGVRHSALGTRHAAATRTAFARLGAGSYGISGNVLNLDGSKAAGAEVVWGWWDSNGYNFGGSNWPTLTGSDGAFSFGAVTSAPTGGNDDLAAWYPPPSSDTASELEVLETWTNDFTTTTDYQLQPGAVDVTIAGLTAALANDAPPDVWVAGTPGSARTAMRLTNGAGTAFAPSSFNDVVAGFYTNQGGMTAATQWQAPDVTVPAGTTDTTAVPLDWGHAQRAYLAGPLCQHSGKPGKVVKLVLKNWPANEKASFYLQGYSKSWDLSKPWKSAGVDHIVPLKVPTGAGVQLCDLHAYRSDDGDLNGLPDLWDMFQVCTFRASAGAIHHGAAIRLSGKVPGGGKVTIYWRHKTAGQPATLAAKGWIKGGRYSINAKTGAFRTGQLHPQHTTWYVAKYKGYDFPAFTSVIKVAVR
jgi:hypothetical protein